MNQISTTLKAHEARSNFYQILNEASNGFRQFTITHRGKPDTIVMSSKEFEGWQETLDIISNKNLLISIEKALKSKKTHSSAEAAKQIGW